MRTSREARKKRKIRKIVFGLLTIVILFSLGFFTGTKILHKSTIAASNNGGNKTSDETSENKTSNETEEKKAPEENVDKDNKETTKPEEVNKDEKVTPSNSTSPEKKNEDTAGKKIAYLTFDDGPSKNITPRILETLDKYDIKATFFLIGQNAEKHPDLVKEERDKGHEIAIHTYSHEYKEIYASTSSFLKDIEKCKSTLTSILGDFNNTTIRFPGGSYGSKRAPFKEAVKKAGYTYVDWNCLNGDAEHSNVPADKLIARVKETSKDKDKIIILMHDAATKKATADSLPQVIEYLKSQGYEFRTLD